MIIEIRGTGVHNAGAELMLRSILWRFRKTPSSIQFAVPPSFGPYAARAAYGLLTKLQSRRISRAAAVAALMPRAFRHSHGLVTDADISVILDASGLHYSDQWGPQNADDMARCTRRWRRTGKKIILLPQAFGPFTSSRLRKAFRLVVDAAHLVFARDTTSLHNVQELVGCVSQLRLAPDITHLIPAQPSPTDVAFSASACIVPNYRMLDKTDAAARGQYLPFLGMCINHLSKQGIQSFILLHDRSCDRRIVEPLQNLLDIRIPVVAEPDPSRLKAIVAASYIVIGSRYHALLSALSQGVPCIGTGWNHKYLHLFEDFHSEDALLPTAASVARVADAIDARVHEPSRTQIKQQLEQCAAGHQTAALQMWNLVDVVIGVSHPGDAQSRPDQGAAINLMRIASLDSTTCK